MHAVRKIYWKGPVVMVTTYLAGLLFTALHHLLYAQLNGTIAHNHSENNESNSNYTTKRSASDDWSMGGQKFNITVGTALAFLVRASLSAAVSTAYTQVAWQSIKQQPRRLVTIDAIFGILGSPAAFLHAPLWRRLPAITLGLIFWLLPLASVVTPGTLRVVLTNTNHSSPTVVPVIDWTSINFASIVPARNHDGWAIEGVYDVLTPGNAVKHAFQTAALVGSIAPLTAPGPNTTWSLDFLGPEMQCSNVSSSFDEKIIGNALDYMTTNRTCGTVWGYLGWQGHEEEPLPFVGIEKEDLHKVRDSGEPTDDIYVAVFPNLMEAITGEWSAVNSSYWCDARDIGTRREIYRQAMTERTIIRCATFNVSYHLEIEFTNGIQQIQTNVLKTHNRVGRIASISDPDPFQAHGTGQYNLTLVQNIAFQSVLGVFQTMLLGGMAAYSGTNFTIFDSRTTIRDTILGGCKEITAIRKHEDANFDRWFKGKYNSISNTEPSRADFPLASQLEELFHNVTISLMSRPALQPNVSSPYAPPLTNVTFYTVQNVFIYSGSTLWLAYGLVLSVSLLCVVYGLYTVMRSRSSFTTQFSTILRASRGAELGTGIKNKDFGGQDPLPKYLEGTKVEFPGSVTAQADEESMDGLTLTRGEGEPQRESVRMSMLRGKSSMEDE